MSQYITNNLTKINVDPTDSERAHITYWQLQKAWWFIVNPLIRHSLTVLQVYALMTKMGKNTEKKNQIKSLPTRQKQNKTNKHCVPFACCSSTTLINTLRQWRHSCGKKHFCVLYLNNCKARQKSQPLAFDSSDFVVHDLSDGIPRFL